MEEDEERIEEDLDRQQEEEEYQLQMQREGWDYPQPKKSESMYALFEKVLKLKDSSKVGNVDKTELGALSWSVRDCQKIAMISEKLKHPDFGNFFRGLGEITLSTSASKNGWLMGLVITQRKITSRSATQKFETETQGGGGWFKKKKRPQSYPG